MKAKTQFEKEVVRLSRQLPPLSGKYKCKSQQLIDYSEARQFRGRKTHIVHFIIITTKGGWQVLRHFYMYAIFKRKKLFKVDYLECMQQWLKEGKYVFMALNRMQGYCDDAWCAGQQMTIKKDYNHCAVLDDPRSIGYDKSYYVRVARPFAYLPTDEAAGIRVDDMYRAVNTAPYWETIIKKSPSAFKFLEKRGITSHKEKAAAVRVALRHGYNVLTPEWVDLIDMLHYLRKDLHNPKYVAPADFKAVHDEISRQAAAKRKKESEKAEELSRIRRERYMLQIEEQRARLAKERMEREKAAVLYYPARRKKFFGLVIAGQGIEIKVLQSVAEFMEEGAAMHHCVFANGYYDVKKKPDCLIMSSKKDGERVETIEVDMSDYHVVQSRGKHNQNTPYHDTILKLMSDNMDRIREINMSNKRTKAV